MQTSSRRLSAITALALSATLGGLVTASSAAAVPTAVAAAPRVSAGDVLAVVARGGSGRAEVHVLARASRYRSFALQTATGLSAVSLATWSFGVGDYDGGGVPDLFAVNTRDNRGRNTAAHVFSGESGFRQAIVHVRLPRMGSASLKAWQFAVGDYNGDRRADLFAVNTRDNRGRNTAAHVFDGAGKLRRFAAQVRLPNMGVAPLGTWQFTAGDYTGDGKADLVAVNTRDNRGRNTAAHVFDAGAGLRRFALHRRLPQMGAAALSTWRFTTADHNGDGRADLVAVNTRDRTGRTAVHAFNAATGYRTYVEHAVSALHRTSVNSWQFHGWTPPRATGDVTLTDLIRIYGSVGAQDVVRAGLASLNAEMRRAGITTPRRKAAFLATLRNESGFRYNAVQQGASAYRGRGFIQLTSEYNYRTAGRYFGIDLAGNPGLAATLTWSAPIARWYWTVARNINVAADRLDMAAVNVAIGYRPNAREDAERCADFKAALRYFNGGVLPGGINCTRGATAASSPNPALRYPADEPKGPGVGE